MITTTLNRIREHKPCEEGWRKLLAHLGKTRADDEPLSFAVILGRNGLDDALWCCRFEPQHAKIWREFAWWAASQVRHLMKDEWSTICLDVMRRHIDGHATDDELAAAGEAAWDAAWTAAGGAAEDAAWAAGGATTAARDAGDAARDAARAAQSGRFLELVSAI